MDKMKMKKRLTEKVSGSLVQEDAPMAKFTSFRAGGCADLLVQPQNKKELQDILQALQEEECPHMVLGKREQRAGEGRWIPGCDRETGIWF